MELYLATVRWIHILCGIMWIGILYYFNFVQVWSFANMEAPARANAQKVLLPRAFLFFRWAALATWVVGVLLIFSYSGSIPGYYSSPRFYAILIGAALGTMMFINVWGIIWPNNKKLIDAVTAGTPPTPAWGRRGFLASRTNTLMSIPLVFFMVAAPFLGSLWQH